MELTPDSHPGPITATGPSHDYYSHLMLRRSVRKRLATRQHEQTRDARRAGSDHLMGDVLFLCLVTFLPQRVRKLLNHPFLRLACGQVDDRQEPRRSNTGSG
jgi:hypothetical protein